MIHDHDTIAAPATAAGGAIAVIRVSGAEALPVCDRIFRSRTPLTQADGYSVHFGRIADGERFVDQALATVFRAPHSYTGEDSVEFSCHGSPFIVSEVLRLLTAAGARMAEPGEFTIRAYLAGKMDLAQAEAVADLIASSSRAAHALAANQLRGGFSAALDALRERLLHLTSLLELELDFSEEEVEFADRDALRRTMEEIGRRIASLSESFALGNAVKEGVPVVIAGAPNVGKSTLLNRLLGEERALVSEIAGTTRDVIEECANIGGVLFRFLDTAGIRPTGDRLEQMGIARTMESISRARIVIRMIDAATIDEAATGTAGSAAAAGDYTVAGSDGSDGSGGSLVPDSHQGGFTLRDDQTLLTVVNKIDTHPGLTLPAGALAISARSGEGVDTLRAALRGAVDTEALYHGDAVVSSSRHREALDEAHEALRSALEGLDSGLPADLLSEDIRCVIRHLGAITARGAIASDEVLGNIFSKFCIGK